MAVAKIKAVTETCQMCTRYGVGAELLLPHLVLYSKVRVFICVVCLNRAKAVGELAPKLCPACCYSAIRKGIAIKGKRCQACKAKR